MTIVNPSTEIPIVDKEGLMTEQFRLFVSDVADMSPYMGSGSPEGVVTAAQWREYIDIDATSGSIKYIKKYTDIGGDRKQGWVLL